MVFELLLVPYPTINYYYLMMIDQPDLPDERERIEAAGGRVIDWNGNRVLGVLATSRSIGTYL